MNIRLLIVLTDVQLQDQIFTQSLIEQVHRIVAAIKNALEAKAFCPSILVSSI